MFEINTNPTLDHLAKVLAWLYQEQVESDEGFFCNRNVIISCFEESHAQCVIEDGQPVAFAVYSSSEISAEISILEVKPSHRGKGLGVALANSLIDNFFLKGSKYIEVECTPETSEPFWRKQGFQTYIDTRNYRDEYDPVQLRLYIGYRPGPRSGGGA